MHKIFIHTLHYDLLTGERIHERSIIGNMQSGVLEIIITIQRLLVTKAPPYTVERNKSGAWFGSSIGKHLRPYTALSYIELIIHSI